MRKNRAFEVHKLVEPYFLRFVFLFPFATENAADEQLQPRRRVMRKKIPYIRNKETKWDNPLRTTRGKRAACRYFLLPLHRWTILSLKEKRVARHLGRALLMNLYSQGIFDRQSRLSRITRMIRRSNSDSDYLSVLIRIMLKRICARELTVNKITLRLKYLKRKRNVNVCQNFLLLIYIIRTMYNTNGAISFFIFLLKENIPWIELWIEFMNVWTESVNRILSNYKNRIILNLWSIVKRKMKINSWMKYVFCILTKQIRKKENFCDALGAWRNVGIWFRNVILSNSQLVCEFNICKRRG